ncbi:MAG: hypothetical protein U5L45_05375 [Saprospiraceae bacterium]|nr:hypothetical protein [Saprospiraceae bacterium]
MEIQRHVGQCYALTSYILTQQTMLGNYGFGQTTGVFKIGV